MKTDSVKYKTFKGNSWRFDPSFHLSEANKVFKTLKRSPYTLTDINNCSERVFLGNIFSRVFVKDSSHGIPYLAASDTVLSNIDTGAFLSKKQAEALSYLKLEKDWILVTCSGTVGNVTYTNKCFENHIATHDLIRIAPSDKTVKRGCLYAYLSSKYGHCLLTQSEFGGVVKHINDDHVKNIPIPQFPVKFQEKVDDLIKESARLREEADNYNNQAINILDSFLKIKFCKQIFKTDVISVKNVVRSLQIRIDTPAFINDGAVTIKRLISAGKIDKKLGDANVRVFRPGIFKRNYVENGYPYIKGSEIFERDPFRRCSFLSKSRTPFVEQMLLKEGQILVTCAGSVGNIKMITKEYENVEAIGSQDIIRIESEDSVYSKEFLFAYLQLPFIQDYIQSMKYGSVIERIEPFHIESVPLIKPTNSVLNEINSLIKKFMQCTYNAFQCENKAISLVEKEIDGWKA